MPSPFVSKTFCKLPEVSRATRRVSSNEGVFGLSVASAKNMFR